MYRNLSNVCQIATSGVNAANVQTIRYMVVPS